jgi:hypothetical protein
MKRQVFSAACGLWLALAPEVQAQQGVVVELYTSQGCSSCPPADAFLGSLTTRAGVIPLALHVDYWDYIGWQDVFANPAFADRQRAYAKAAGEKMIYTPQIVVGGGERVIGSDPEKVLAALERHVAKNPAVTLMVVREGAQLVIRLQADPPLSEGTMVQLVRYRPSATVDIERGENAGARISYHNIVTSWQEIGTWSGKEPAEIKAGLDGDGPAVVIVQKQGPSEILAAYKVD